MVGSVPPPPPPRVIYILGSPLFQIRLDETAEASVPDSPTNPGFKSRLCWIFSPTYQGFKSRMCWRKTYQYWFTSWFVFQYIFSCGHFSHTSSFLHSYALTPSNIDSHRGQGNMSSLSFGIFHTLHHSQLSNLQTLIIIEGKETCRRYLLVFFSHFIIPSSLTFKNW